MNNFCPKCGNDIVRTKRTFKDKLLTSFIDSIIVIRRYHCQRCEWSGLRRKKIVPKHTQAVNVHQQGYKLVP